MKMVLNTKEDYSKSEDWWDTLNKEEFESINRGLKDFEDGKTHPNQTARQVYEKYLNLKKTKGISRI